MGKDEVDEGRQVSGGARDERKEDKTPRRMGGQVCLRERYEGSRRSDRERREEEWRTHVGER